MKKSENIRTESRQVQIIGFSRRLAAALIDGFILLMATTLLSLGAGILGVYLNFYSNNEPIPVTTLVIVCGLIISVLYYVAAWSNSGQTIDKSVFGIQVVGSDGQPLSIGKAFLRYLGYILSALPLSIGFLWIVFDKKNQGWHDKIASSYAIDGGADYSEEEKLEFVPAGTKPGWFWLAIWFLIAMVAPPALISSLFILGPTLGRIITDLF